MQQIGPYYQRALRLIDLLYLVIAAAAIASAMGIAIAVRSRAKARREYGADVLEQIRKSGGPLAW